MLEEDLVIGHEEIKKFFFPVKTHQENLGRFFIFHGPFGIGKSLMAQVLCARLLENTDDRDVRISHQWVKHRSHPGLIWIDRTTLEEPSKEITLAHINPIFTKLSQRISEGEWRVVVIDDGDYLNRFSANALLKTLEELPKRTTVILIAHCLEKMIPTLRSRGCMISMKGLNVEQMNQVITTKGWLLSPILSQFAKGRPGLYEQFLSLGADPFIHSVKQCLKEKKPGLSHYTISLIEEKKDLLEPILQSILHVVNTIIIDHPTHAQTPSWTMMAGRLTQLTQRGYFAHLDPKMLLATIEGLLING
jgi:hypothetical protein